MHLCCKSYFYIIIILTVLFGTSSASEKLTDEIDEGDNGENEQKARSLINDLQTSALQFDEASLDSMLNSRSVKDPKASTKKAAAKNGTSKNGIMDVIFNSQSVQALLKPENFGLILNSKSFKNLFNPSAIEHFLNSKVGKQIINTETLSNLLNSDVVTSKFTPTFVEQLLESVMGVAGVGSGDESSDLMQAVMDSKMWKTLPKMGSLKLLVCSDILAEKDSSGGATILQKQNKKQQPHKPKQNHVATTYPKTEIDNLYDPYQPKMVEDEAYLSKYKNPYEYSKPDDDKYSPEKAINDPYSNLDDGLYHPKPPKKYNPLASSQLSYKPVSYQSSTYNDPYSSSGYSYGDPASAISSDVFGLLNNNNPSSSYSSPYSSSSFSSYPSENEKVNYTLRLLDMFLPPGSASSSSWSSTADLAAKKKKKPYVVDVETVLASSDSSDEFSASPSLGSHISSTLLENPEEEEYPEPESSPSTDDDNKEPEDLEVSSTTVDVSTTVSTTLTPAVPAEGESSSTPDSTTDSSTTQSPSTSLTPTQSTPLVVPEEEEDSISTTTKPSKKSKVVPKEEESESEEDDAKPSKKTTPKPSEESEEVVTPKDSRNEWPEPDKKRGVGAGPNKKRRRRKGQYA